MIPNACYPSYLYLSAAPATFPSLPPADEAFVKSADVCAPFFEDPFDGRCSSDGGRGVRRLQALIDRAAGGSAATSLYLFPFLNSSSCTPNDDELLRLIAQLCPNLKYFSFRGSYDASRETVLEFFSKCRNLELVDFTDSFYSKPIVLQEMSAHCPKIRGIRRNGKVRPSFASKLTSFPNLMLLNLSGSTIIDKDLLTIVTGCNNLQYLDITGCENLTFYMHIIKVASRRIAEILDD